MGATKSLQSCPTLCDPIDGSPPDSPIPGILQARTLEWVATFFSNAWKWKVKVKSLSHFWLLATPWTAAYQAPPTMGFSRQEYWCGLLFPSPGAFPNPGIKPTSPALQVDSLPLSYQGSHFKCRSSNKSNNFLSLFIFNWLIIALQYGRNQTNHLLLLLIVWIVWAVILVSVGILTSLWSPENSYMTADFKWNHIFGNWLVVGWARMTSSGVTEPLSISLFYFPSKLS